MKKRVSLSIALAALLSLGMFAVAAPAPVAHAAGSATITRSTSGPTAFAGFTVLDGDIEGFVQVTAALKGFQSPTPISGPAVQVFVSEFNQVTQESFFGMGVAPAPGFQIDSKGLTSATLPAVTVPVAATDEFGDPIGTPFDVHVAVIWTGTGPLNFQSATFHTRIPHVLNETAHFKSMSRAATALGTISYPSPLAHATITLTNAAADFADLSISSSMDIVVQH